MLTLPLVHLLFPLIVLLGASVGSLGYFVAYCTASVYECKNFLDPWGDVPKAGRDYWRMHVEFVRELCESYVHRTGVPRNWDGRRYGIPFGPGKLALGVVLLVFGTLACGAGNAVIVTSKLLPMAAYVLYHFMKFIFTSDCNDVIVFFPFIVVGFCFVLLSIPTCYVMALLLGPLLGCFCPYVAIRRDNFLLGFKMVRHVLVWVDKVTAQVTPGGKCHLLVCVDERRELDFDDILNLDDMEEELEVEAATGGGGGGEVRRANRYWDLFADVCVTECRLLLNKGWIKREDVESADPSAVLAVPAAAALAVLANSVRNSPDGGKKCAIVWPGQEGITCDEESRPRDDNIVQHLWPKVSAMRRAMASDGAGAGVGAADGDNVDLLRARICCNQEGRVEELEAFLKTAEAGEDKSLARRNKELLQMLTDFSLHLSRMGPMNDRFAAIFGYQY